MSTGIGDLGVVPQDASVDEAGTAPGDRRFRPDVEGLRAVAILLVVLYHADLPGLSGGFVGVDVFFVISGFVITGLLLREQQSTGRTSLAAFYGRRARRILPAATVVIVTVVIATYVVLGAYVGNPTAVTARWTAVFLANFHFAAIGTSYLTASQPPSPLQNFWSLAVEEQFYLVFPAIVLLAAAFRSRMSFRVRLGAILVPVILASILLSAIQTGTSPNTAFFSPLTRAWELALGAVVAISTPALLRLHRTTAAVLTWVGLAAILVAAFAYSATTSYPGTAVILPVVGAALVIAGGVVVPRAGAESILRLGPVQWLGRLSYSLYLWHWPILIIAAESAGRSSLPFRSNVVWLLVAVAAAAVSYHLVENPVRHARRLVRSRGLTLALGTVLVAVSLMVATIALATHSPSSTRNSYRTGASVPSLTPQQVLGLVRASTKITTLPHDLTPTLASIHSDWGGPNQPCWPDFGSSTVGTCLFGDLRGTHTVALYGDSHAAMWFDVLDRIAKRSHWRLLVLAKGACPVLDLAFGNPPGVLPADGRFAACDRWHRFALARLDAVRPDLVLISEDAELGPGGTAHPPTQWEQAMTRAIGRLPVPATRVVVIGNTPQAASLGPECLSLHPNDVQKCSGPNPSYFTRYNDAERQAAVATGARYLDMMPWFCSTTCTDVIGRYQPYWDPTHVAATYSMVLRQVLGDLIDLPAYESPSRASDPPSPAGSG